MSALLLYFVQFVWSRVTRPKIYEKFRKSQRHKQSLRKVSVKKALRAALRGFFIRKFSFNSYDGVTPQTALRIERNTTVLFSELASNVIFSIFARCDISSVVSTCRYLHALAFDESVWLGLLHNLQRRAILDRDFTPSLETLSTDEMIGAVRRLHMGPQTWSPENVDSDCAAEVTKTITLHPIGNGPGRSAKLLPSGRYILFHNWGSALECWNVAEDKMVWRYTATIEQAKVSKFTAEEREIELTIMIIIRIHSDDRELNYVEIVSVDLQSGTQNRLLTARAPDFDPDYDDSLSDPAICGNLASVNTADNQHMIINLATQSYFIVDDHPGYPTCIALIPQHIILMNISRDQKNKIHLISNDAISAYLVPIITPDGDAKFSSILAEDIPKRGTFEDVHAEQFFNDMYVHESPLREGDYRLWIYGMNLVANTGGFSIFSCTLSIPSNAAPRWCQRSRPVRTERAIYTPVSYSGHSLQQSSPGDSIVFSAACPAAPKPVVRMPA
ncbi:hypothetical protein C8R45DRAFT_1131177 [Mycena sanguinolenta]|nr:hypothetical protein C8R45DRAFT_1131177 [Mycena sanguinolenta]